MKRTFTALTTTVELAVDDELGINELATFLVAAYPAATTPPAVSYHLRDGVMVAVDRYDDPVADRSDLVPLFELDLYQQVAERAEPGWLLHAATLEKAGRAYVFAGPSGAGKTSLTLELLARGWRLVTEEMTLVDRQLGVRGLARPIHLVAGSPQHRALPKTWRQLAYPVRGRATAIVAHPPERAAMPLPLAAIARIGHAEGAAPRLEPLAAHRAITRLWDCTLRQNDDGLATAVAIAATARLVELESASVSDAVTLAELI